MAFFRATDMSVTPNRRLQRHLPRLLTPLSAALLAGLAPAAANATNGYFSDGYGARSQGQGGVAVAWAQDSLVIATNPAGIAWVDDRIDAGLDWFRPSRGTTITGNAFGPDGTYSGDALKNFFIPNLGYVHHLTDTLSAGVAVYGNGGLNTQYDTNPFARFGAGGAAGVNLEQLFLTPAIAWKPVADQSLGLGLNLAYQQFSARGISIFSGASLSPGNVSDQGTDRSLGLGVRLGWSGTLLPGLTGGLTWASRIRGSFSDYRGLFADGGRFDVPSNLAAGLAYRPTTDWTFGVDVQRINYAQVAPVGDPLAALLQGVPLGATNGPGFGWDNITVVKLGASYQINPAWTLRAGYSHSGQPVPSSQTFFNILAPGVVQNHYTVGATWTTPGKGEWSAFAAIAPSTTVAGSGSIPPGYPPGFGGGEANVHLSETIFGVSWAWKL